MNFGIIAGVALGSSMRGSLTCALSSCSFPRSPRTSEYDNMKCSCEIMRCDCLKPCDCGEAYHIDFEVIRIEGRCWCNKVSSGCLGCQLSSITPTTHAHRRATRYRSTGASTEPGGNGAFSYLIETELTQWRSSVSV